MFGSRFFSNACSTLFSLVQRGFQKIAADRDILVTVLVVALVF